MRVMMERARSPGPSRWPVAGTIASGLVLCGLLAACGADHATTPGTESPNPTPPPAPTPSPAVTRAGYLHVLQRPWVMTYEIDPTGRLRPPITQHLGRDTYVLAGEPQGRFVYVPYGGWQVAWNGSACALNGSDMMVVTYAPDPRDGALAPVSEATISHAGGWCGDRAGWVWLSGGANRVHGLSYSRWGSAGRHLTYIYVSVVVASDGQLDSVSRRAFDFDADPGHVIVDVRSDVLYKAANTPTTPGTINARGGLRAYVIEPDGQLTPMGWTNLCVAATIPPLNPPRPVLAARGILFAQVSLEEPERKTVCSYQGLRLRSLAELGISSFPAKAFVPSSEAMPVLIAMAGTGPEGPELRLFAMNGDGDLQLLDSEDLPNPCSRFLFHPSGRFLYVVDTAARLRSYSVDSAGQLEFIESIDDAWGSMAITLGDAESEVR